MSAGAWASPLTTIGQIRALTPAQIAHNLPVDLRGVVTYYQRTENILFIADRTGGIFIRVTRPVPVAQGDRVEVRGVAMPSYSAVVNAASIRVMGRAAMPPPVPATFSELMSGQDDCAYVTIAGTIVSATMQQTTGRPYLLLSLRMAGGYAGVHVENAAGLDVESLLDARVRLTGVSGGRFDGRFQLVGAILYLGAPAQMRITAPAPRSLSSLPFTPIPKVLSAYNVDVRSPRVRVRGSVTYYQPGEELVLERSRRAILIHTHQGAPLRIGDEVDATGFADAHGYSQVLGYGQFSAPHGRRVIRPQPVSWQDAAAGKYPYSLVSLEGRVIDQVHGSRRDSIYINSGGYIFPAILDHPYQPDARLPRMSRGSTVRVSGVCFVASGGAWNNAMGFDLYLRGAPDIEVLARPSRLTIRRLLYLVGALGFLTLVFFVWSALLRRRVRLQTRLIRRTLETEAARERHQAHLARNRSRVLEAINSRMPLDEVLRMITSLASGQSGHMACWCELASGEIAGGFGGVPPGVHPDPRYLRRDILSSGGKRLGALVLAQDPDGAEPAAQAPAQGPAQSPAGSEILDICASLAALAIESRHLYEQLVHRSEYDQLTEVANRFLLGARLKETFARARLLKRRFALIYIDLNHFKLVNDRYGHRVGDLYLQHATRRLMERLRAQDTLARVGGDEFVALIPVVQDRAEAEGVARRLEQCFDSPFHIDGQTLRGSASLGVAVYPEDGSDEDQLQRYADTEMYARKQLRMVDWE